LFPEGKDPADMVKGGDLNSLKNLFENGKDLAIFVIEQIKNSYDINNPYEKQKAIEEVNSYLNTLKPIVREVYASKSAQIFSVQVGYFRVKNLKVQNTTPQINQNNFLKDPVLNVLDFSFAKSYEGAFRDLASGNLQNPILRGIIVDDSVPILNEEEFKEHIIDQLILYYNNKYRAIKTDRNLNYNKKAFLLRKIKTDILPKLKAGEMIIYEGDFTI